MTSLLISSNISNALEVLYRLKPSKYKLLKIVDVLFLINFNNIYIVTIGHSQQNYLVK